jgi:hypothetical protein
MLIIKFSGKILKNQKEEDQLKSIGYSILSKNNICKKIYSEKSVYRLYQRFYEFALFVHDVIY